jgi:hypothetical protein
MKPSCPITADPRKRAAADKMTAKIACAFPSGLPQPALRALANAGYTKLEQVKKVSDAELLALHGMGPKAIAILRGKTTRQ